MNSKESQINEKLYWNIEFLEKFKQEFVNRIIIHYAETLLEKFQENNKIIDFKALEKIEYNVKILFFRFMARIITGFTKSDLELKYPGKLFNNLLDHYKIPEINSINCMEINHDIISEARNIFPPFRDLPPSYLGSIYEEIQDLILKIKPIKSEIEKIEKEGNFFNKNKKKIFLDKNRISRKHLGSFYTPHYISEYIIKHSIEPILEEKINNLQKSGKMGFDFLLNEFLDEILSINILDPAMGAGFFLIDSANFILNQCLEIIHTYYKENPVQLESEIQSEIGLYKKNIIKFLKPEKISINEEELLKLIYAKSIYGVDIDPFAVELTKLIVWLSFHPDVKLKKEDLSFINKNFRCGNSLLTPLEEIFKKEDIKFDAIIGNPPYGALFSNDEKKKMKKSYKTTSRDSSAYLLEMSIKQSFYSVGVIVPKSIAFYSSWESIRKFIIDNTNIIRIADPGIAFQNVIFEELILILRTNECDKSGKKDEIAQEFVEIDVFNKLKQPVNKKQISKSGKIPYSLLKEDNVLLFRPLIDFEFKLLDKINKNSIKIKDLKRTVSRGLYIPDSEKKEILENSFNHLYKINWTEKHNKFDYINYVNKVPDVGKYYVKKIYHIPFKFLDNPKYLRRIEKISTPKIFIKVLRGKRIICYPDNDGLIIPTEKLVCLLLKEDHYSLNYICAILNSKIASWYLQKTLFSDVTETSRVLDDIYLKKIPIPKIDFSLKKSVNNEIRNEKLLPELKSLILEEKYEQINEKIINFYRTSVEIHDFITFLVDKIINSEKNYNNPHFNAINELIERIVSVLYGLDENEYNYISEYFTSHDHP